MSVEGEVDLDALIEKDKKEAKIRKTKQIQKQKQHRREVWKRSDDDFNRRGQDKHKKDKTKYQKYNDERKQQDKPKSTPNFGSYYAISISGLLSDVSVDDICKLLGDRKIISIKTMLRNKDRSPIQSKSVSLMDVTVVLADKNQADSFVKSYSQRKLDGKYELAFSFINANQELQ